MGEMGKPNKELRVMMDDRNTLESAENEGFPRFRPAGRAER